MFYTKPVNCGFWIVFNRLGCEIRVRAKLLRIIEFLIMWVSRARSIVVSAIGTLLFRVIYNIYFFNLSALDDFESFEELCRFHWPCFRAHRINISAFADIALFSLLRCVFDLRWP